MRKADLDMLEKAFNAEISAALNHGVPIIQSKSIVAKRLVDEGLLQKKTWTSAGQFPVRVSGYILTHAGRIAYCSECAEGAPNEL